MPMSKSLTTIQRELADREPVDQEEFVEKLVSEGIEQSFIFDSLNELMQQDKISYTVEWDLQVENR